MYQVHSLAAFLPGSNMDNVLAEAMRILIVGFLIWLAVINIAAFWVFGWDKWLAKRKEKHPKTRRIPEAVLFLFAILGGSIGALLGMRIWHHKTLHKSFRFGIPLILALQVILVALLVFWVLK